MFRHPVKYLIIGNILAAILIGFLIFGEQAQPQERSLPVSLEPADQCGVQYLLNGLVETGYDTDQNGVADHFTLSRLQADGLPQHQPLFYGTDVDEDGAWEIVFKDIQEDGINGNEEEYWKGLPVGK